MVTLRLDAPATLSLIGDHDELVRLVENLIGNAIKYGSFPDQQSNVDVSLVVIGNEARLRVRDHGAGIAREHIPRLTERFYRIDADASRANGGTGLGLALVKHIVLRHRGRLEIISNPGEGACFDIWLPLPRTSNVDHAEAIRSDPVRRAAGADG
jgi:two-component system phosphate regulon sensor histidine kinase PhoR